MPQPRRTDDEIVRKTSVRTHRSQTSNTSVVKPLNSTRLNGPIPRMGSVPQLAPPEFGPPLTYSDLNLSIPYAAVPSTIRPSLRETKSFFSDDSSARRQRKSLKEKLHLHSLRNVVPGSAGTSLIAHTARSNDGIKLSHSCQLKGHKPAANPRELPTDTIPMTDFTYRKRKMLERLKEWWKRQCIQKVVTGKKRKARTVPGAPAW
ncbi:uncharacterized protein HMPREF1541_05465 [Cyphellophora europaea CBS 101466]|uniref:Uncharacterized protein n=1 Tax=Cyphellophora europaea (strain CBS 101466) TaxID=1220924 RepID=W2RS06_CYPE1|nr:uncharacterized protein HMPREF1541_05465 [Cyphellophora europaea CBS 101466]ETN39242.1 hypothetical protein HMPREF1541_05465 [Cyphellophora europaea CBS 101466]